jgi:nitrate reductase alpha subunit
MSRAAARAAPAIPGISTGNRLKYPLIRSRCCAVARGAHDADAGRGLGLDRREPGKAREILHQDPRPWRLRPRNLGRGQRDHRGGQRLHREDLWGPDRVFGFSPIPAMSMVSYAAGTRYLSRCSAASACRSTTGIAICRRPRRRPGASRPTFRNRRLVQCRLPHPVGLERAADAHARRPFLHRSALQGRQERRDLPDYSEASKFADLWLHPKQGTDAALAMAMGHVILRNSMSTGRPTISTTTPQVHRHADAGAPGQSMALLCAGALPPRLDFAGGLDENQQSGMEDGRL